MVDALVSCSPLTLQEIEGGQLQGLKDLVRGKMTLLPGAAEMARVLESLDLAIQAQQVLVRQLL